MFICNLHSEIMRGRLVHNLLLKPLPQAGLLIAVVLKCDNGTALLNCT